MRVGTRAPGRASTPTEDAFVLLCCPSSSSSSPLCHSQRKSRGKSLEARAEQEVFSFARRPTRPSRSISPSPLRLRTLQPRRSWQRLRLIHPPSNRTRTEMHGLSGIDLLRSSRTSTKVQRGIVSIRTGNASYTGSDGVHTLATDNGCVHVHHTSYTIPAINADSRQPFARTTLPMATPGVTSLTNMPARALTGGARMVSQVSRIITDASISRYHCGTDRTVS